MPLNSRLLLPIVLLAATAAAAQIRHDTAKPVDPADQIRPLLVAHREQIAEGYKRDGTRVPQFTEWVRVDSAAAGRVFPGLRFASLEWGEAADPAAKAGLVSLAGGLQMTLAIDPKAGAVVARLPGDGNYEAFGALLIDRRVTVRGAADAKAVWEAFCDIHHKHWQAYPLKRTADAEWRLGLYTYDQTVAYEKQVKTVVTQTHYMRVRTDPETGRVLEWESVVETSNRRRVRAKAE